VTLLSCIGCGARDLIRPCTGDCADRKLELVPATDHERLLELVADARRSVSGLLAVALPLASAEPTAVDAETAYRKLQRAARDALARRHDIAEDVSETPPEPIVAWWCATCGRIEAPQPCIGVCIRQPERLVGAALYDDAFAQASGLRRAEQPLGRLARLVASLHPASGEWRRTWHALRPRARTALAAATDAIERPGGTAESIHRTLNV
jgi:hypothetical protein